MLDRLNSEKSTFPGGAVVAQSPVARSSGIPRSVMPEKRTYADRAAYMVEAVRKRRIKLRKMARDYKGGKCESCGYSKCQRALSFHHLDPNKKSFGVSDKGLTRSWERIRDEIDKCVLICANCHMEVHEGITQLPVRKAGRKTR